jgi:hypothetical protein
MGYIMPVHGIHPLVAPSVGARTLRLIKVINAVIIANMFLHDRLNRLAIYEMRHSWHSLTMLSLTGFPQAVSRCGKQ